MVPPSSAQENLSASQIQRQHFLACQCRPTQDMRVALPGTPAPALSAVVQHKSHFAPDILCLQLRLSEPLTYRPGQFIRLQRADGLTRRYSIANLPNTGPVLELHIRRLDQGEFSRWAHETLAIGDALTLSPPQGDCHYQPGNPNQPLLLIGTGTGLAPLLGILHDALAQGHSGPIELYHGSRAPAGLYLHDHLQTLMTQHTNFRYTGCLSGPNLAGFAAGRAHNVAFADKTDLKPWRIYLCGHPEMVKDGQRMAYLKGAALRNIFADAFATGQT